MCELQNTQFSQFIVPFCSIHAFWRADLNEWLQQFENLKKFLDTAEKRDIFKIMKLDSDNRNNSSKTVDTALRLLQLVGNSSSPVSVSYAAALVGTSPAAAHRLLQSLTKSGLVVQHDNRAYGLGPAVLELAQRYLDGIDLRQRFRPLLNEIRDLTGETTCLIIKQGLKRVCIDFAWSRFDIAYIPQLGETMPITVGATGRAYLSTLPETTRRRVLSEILDGQDQVDHAGHVDIDRALDLIEIGKQQGYFVSISERISGMTGVAVPITNRQKGLLATISIIGPADRWTEDRISEVCPEVVRIVNSYPNLDFHLNN